MFTNSIRRRVLRVVEAKIDEAQKAFDEALLALETKYNADKVELLNKFKSDKEEEATKAVDSIVGKLF